VQGIDDEQMGGGQVALGRGGSSARGPGEAVAKANSVLVEPRKAALGCGMLQIRAFDGACRPASQG
jgi:hypothetical protein